MVKKRAPYDKKQNYIVETKAVSNTKSGPPIVAISRKVAVLRNQGRQKFVTISQTKFGNVKAWGTPPIYGDFMQR